MEQSMMEIALALWDIFRVWFQTILVLTIADLLLGITAALVKGVYDWRKVADFMKTNLVPKFLGYVIATFISYFASVETLGEYGEILGGAIEVTARVAIITSLAGSILGHFQTIGILPPSTDKIMARLGLPLKSYEDKGGPTYTTR